MKGGGTTTTTTKIWCLSSSSSSSIMMMQLQLLLIVFIFIFGFLTDVVHGYPMMVEIPEDSERCLNYNIPQDEDAHFVFLAVPSAAAETEDIWITKQKKLEEYFLLKMIELTKYRVHTTLPKKFVGEPTPDDITKIQDEFLIEYDNELKSGVKVKITNPESSSSRTMDTYWNTPVVMNHIRRAVRNKDDSTPLQGYSICFTNNISDYPIMIMMDGVSTDEVAASGGSEDGDDDDTKAASFDGSHLTPLSEQLSESIAAAKTVVKEMNYMASREERMRKTADSINARVRYFSYISVIVLLVVTYLQVTYLKRYFRKKKLL